MRQCGSGCLLTLYYPFAGSTDQTVCLWALDSCQLLNTIPVATGVSLLGLSPDSVFLLVVLDDNQLVLHSTATGTEIHALRGHRAKVSVGVRARATLSRRVCV